VADKTMKKQLVIKLLTISAVFVLLGGAMGIPMASGHISSDSLGPLLQVVDPLGFNPGDTIVYMPLIFKTFPQPPTVYGIQLNAITEAGGLSKVAELKSTWVGEFAILWNNIESTQGVYDWSSLASQERQLKNVVAKGLTPIVNVRFTPTWAQLYDGYLCGPMEQQYFDEFATFLQKVVERYSVAPYNVKYWEIWNEEDIDHAIVPPGSYWGCWGDSTDPYYGGGYYAEMLKVVYPVIKAADPEAQVMVGGLLLDCDPRPGAGCLAVGHDPGPSMFLEGILSNNGGPYFDGIAFHAYEYYYGSLGQYGNPNWGSAWNTTGPTSMAKVQFIQELLGNYSVTGKFLINTEAALLCDSCTNDADFETTKANYVAESYAGAIASGLKGNLWYTLLGWRNSGLVNADLSPRPGYIAYQFSRNELRDASFVQKITSFGGVMGYEFNRGDRRIWVLWSRDGYTHNVTMSPAPLAVCDVLGSCSPSPALPLAITISPVYLEFNP
jgi:hypothetical protein